MKPHKADQSSEKSLRMFLHDSSAIEWSEASHTL